MTIAFGVNLGSCALLVADTRTTWYMVGVPFYDDESPKIQKTMMGLVTGAGFCPLLDNVKKRLGADQIMNTDQILAIVREETKRVRQVWEGNPSLDAWVQQTGWIFSYSTMKDGGPVFRLGLHHPRSSKDAIGIFEVGSPAIIWPVELTQEIVNAISPPLGRSN